MNEIQETKKGLLMLFTSVYSMFLSTSLSDIEIITKILLNTVGIISAICASIYYIKKSRQKEKIENRDVKNFDKKD